MSHPYQLQQQQQASASGSNSPLATPVPSSEGAVDHLKNRDPNAPTPGQSAATSAQANTTATHLSHHLARVSVQLNPLPIPQVALLSAATTHWLSIAQSRSGHLGAAQRLLSAGHGRTTLVALFPARAVFRRSRRFPPSNANKSCSNSRVSRMYVRRSRRELPACAEKVQRPSLPA